MKVRHNFIFLTKRQIFKKLFEEGLQIQKQRLRDLRNYAREKRAEQKIQHQNELDSMENYYKDQVSSVLLVHILTCFILTTLCQKSAYSVL